MLPLALLKAVPLWAYPAAGLVLWAGCATVQKHQALQETQRVLAEVQQGRADAEAVARLKELGLADINAEAARKLSVARAERQRAAAGADGRLRDLAAAWAASAASAGAGAACRDDGAPAVAIIRDETRGDLVELAQEAQAVSERLQVCQQWVRDTRKKLNEQLPQ